MINIFKLIICKIKGHLPYISYQLENSSYIYKEICSRCGKVLKEKILT